MDALSRSGRRRAAFEAALGESEAAEHWTLRFRVRFFPWVDIAFGALVAATVLWAGWLSLHGVLTIGAAVSVALYSERLVDPIGDVVGWLDEIQVAATGYSRLLGWVRCRPIARRQGTVRSTLPSRSRESLTPIATVTTSSTT